MVDGEAHALIVAYATKKDTSIYQAATEMVVAGAAYLTALKAAEMANPLKIPPPTESTD